MHRDSACAEFQMQYTFILDSAKINSCSYFVKVLKKQKFQQDFMELQPQHQLSRVPEPGRKTPVYPLVSLPIPTALLQGGAVTVQPGSSHPATPSPLLPLTFSPCTPRDAVIPSWQWQTPGQAGEATAQFQRSLCCQGCLQIYLQT